MSDPLTGRGRERAARGLDILVVLAVALLVVTLVLWRSSWPAGRWTQLRPEDVLAGGLILLAVRCGLRPPRWPDIAPGRLVAAGVALYALTFSFITIGRHRTFQTHALDLGQYAQSMWQIAHGQPPYDTITGWHVLGNHFSPIFYVFAPATLVMPGPAWLLALQSLALALGAVPLYLLARRQLAPRLAGAVALLYLVNPSLHGINVRDFHPAALAVPLLLTATYAWESDRRVLFGLATLLTLTTREDAALAVLGLGLWLAIGRRRWLPGIVVVLLSVAWLFTTVQWLMPALRDDATYPYVAGHYGHLGGSLGAVALSPLLRPRAVLLSLLQWTRLRYLLVLLAPLGFLPLLAPLAAVGALPGLAQNALSDYRVLLNYRSQYQSFVLPFLLVGAVAGLARLERGRRAARWLTSRRALAAAALASGLLTARTVNELAVSGWWPGPRHRAAGRLMRMIEPAATVSAGERFFPHLYDRAVPFVFPDRAAASDYVLLDGSTLRHGTLGSLPATRDGDVLVVRLPPPRTELRLRIVGEDHQIFLLRPDH